MRSHDLCLLLTPLTTLSSRPSTITPSSMIQTSGLLTIDISGNHIGEPGARIIQSSLQNVFHLSRLSLRNCGMYAEGALAMCPGLFLCESLKYLDLSENALGLTSYRDEETTKYSHSEAAVRALFLHLGSNANLRVVDISYNDLFGIRVDGSIVHLLDGIKLLETAIVANNANGSLVSLNILGNHLPCATDNETFQNAEFYLESLFTECSRHHSLKSLLGLSREDVELKSMRRHLLTPAVSDSDLISVADLSTKTVTPLWMKILANEINGHSHISAINLDNNPFVGDVGLKYLVDPLRNSLYLRSCRVHGTNISKAMQVELELAKQESYERRILSIIIIVRSFRYLGGAPLRAMMEYMWGADVSLEQIKY